MKSRKFLKEFVAKVDECSIVLSRLIRCGICKEFFSIS